MAIKLVNNHLNQREPNIYTKGITIGIHGFAEMKEMEMIDLYLNHDRIGNHAHL